MPPFCRLFRWYLFHFLSFIIFFFWWFRLRLFLSFMPCCFRHWYFIFAMRALPYAIHIDFRHYFRHAFFSTLIISFILLSLIYALLRRHFRHWLRFLLIFLFISLSSAFTMLSIFIISFIFLFRLRCFRFLFIFMLWYWFIFCFRHDADISAMPFVCFLMAFHTITRRHAAAATPPWCYALLCAITRWCCFRLLTLLMISRFSCLRWLF